MANFTKVETALENAKGIAWDECHRIYVLMDDQQIAQMHQYGYPQIITIDEMSKEDLLATLQNWYDESCELRFIQSIATNYEDPNLGFDDLIVQFEDEED